MKEKIKKLEEEKHKLNEKYASLEYQIEQANKQTDPLEERLKLIYKEIGLIENEIFNLSLTEEDIKRMLEKLLHLFAVEAKAEGYMDDREPDASFTVKGGEL